MKNLILACFIIINIGLFSCSSPEQFIYQEKVGITQIMPSGVQIVDEVIGTGAKPTYRCIVNVNMKIVLEDGFVYVNTEDSGQPYSFQMGLNEVIPGVEEALETMKVGGKRKIIVPPKLAFGKKGVPGKIRPDETVTVYIELLDVRHGRYNSHI